MKRIPLTFISFASSDTHEPAIGVFITGMHDTPEACRVASELGLNPGKGWQALAMAVPHNVSEADYRKSFDFVGKQVSADEMRELFGSKSYKELTLAEQANVRTYARGSVNQ